MAVARTSNALIHSIKTYNLSAQNTQRFLLIEKFDGHGTSARIVGGVVFRGKNNLFVREARFLSRVFIDSGCGGRHVKHLDDRGSISSVIRAIQSAEMVGGNTPLFVGRSGQRYQP